MVRNGRVFLALGALALGGAFFSDIATAADKPLLRLRAFAIDMSRPGRGAAGTLEIVIERWSTDADRQRLRDALVERGSDRLLSTLRGIEPRAGYIRGANTLGWDIQYAREEV